MQYVAQGQAYDRHNQSPIREKLNQTMRSERLNHKGNISDQYSNHGNPHNLLACLPITLKRLEPLHQVNILVNYSEHL